MELVIIFLCWIVPLVLTGYLTYRHGYLAIAEGKIKFDKLEHPTLYRIQRHLYVSDVKQREIEASRTLQAIETAREKESLAVSQHSQKMLQAKKAKHRSELYSFDADFQEITRERDEAERRRQEAEAAKERERIRALEAEERERALAIWTANEKARLDRFHAEQRALEESRREQALSLFHEREDRIQALQTFQKQDAETMRFGYRTVSVHGLYVRSLPTKSARLEGNLTQGAVVGVNGWIRGEEVYGNPIWFKLADDVGWIWAGGVDNKSTSGLVNYNYMNEPGESHEVRSMSGGVVNTYTEPSQMQRLVQREIEILKRENSVQGTRIVSGGLTISAGSITANHFKAGSISSGEDHDFITPKTQVEKRMLAKTTPVSEFYDDDYDERYDIF